ncbi:PAS domain-containing protein [Pelagibius sp.]|uniref:PAS domain-containing protein n=1 Tax=Pelagibius sp. TaxID=1931238 RepID=UPI003B50E5FD
MLGLIESQPLKLLLAHYLEVRGARRLPARSDIDALKLGPVLSVIWINEYEPEAGTFRYRLAGEEVNAVFGTSVSGRLLSDFVAEEFFAPVNENFLRVIDAEEAMLVSGPMYRCAERVAIGERLALPLSSDGEKADGIIGATVRRSLVDLDSVAFQDQQRTFVSIDDLENPIAGRAAQGPGC